MSAHTKNLEEIEKVFERLRRVDVGRDAITLLVARLIELKFPESRVEFISNAELKVFGSEGESFSFYLQNLWAECERSPEARAEIVDRYVRVLLPNANADAVISSQTIVPLVRDSVYRAFTKEEELDVVTLHLIGDLWIIYAVDLPESTNTLSAEQVVGLGLNAAELLRIGKSNVERLLGPLEFRPFGACYEISCEDVLYASSSLLLKYVWDQAAELLGDEVVVSVPARDTVLFTGAKNAEGLRELREAANHVTTHGHHTITGTLFRWTHGEWKLFL